jgi:hypothetical protein
LHINETSIMMDLSYKVHNVKFEYFDKSWHIFEDTQEMHWNTEYGSDNGTYCFLALTYSME